jgi:Uma2 family endonuclease
VATALAKSKPMTADEFYDFVHQPGNEDRFFELERGEVIELPPPSEVHGFVCSIAAWILTNYTIRRETGYVCTNDTGIIVEKEPDSVRGADVAVYMGDANIDTMERRYSRKPPRLVVEVLSPSDKPGRVVRRTTEYLKCGVSLVWIVDPEARIVTTHRKGREQLTLGEGDVLTGETALSGLKIPVADFFTKPGGKGGRRLTKRKPKGRK